MVVRRRDLDHVHADDRQLEADPAHRVQQLPGAETATVTYEYGAANSINDQISRVANLDLGANAVASYAYLGVGGGGQVVTTTLDQAGVNSGVFDSSGTTYPYLDRFGRITSSRWTRGADFYRVDLAYDRNSNITRAQDYIHTWASGNRLFDVSYINDNLNRLSQALEGHWNGSAITGKTRDEQWTLSQTGNWANRKLNLNAEFYLPVPGSGNDRTLRLFLWSDAGNVWGENDKDASLDDLRASAGIGLSWVSPVGPLKLSYGTPLRKFPQDRIQKFQFQIGTAF